MRRFQTEDEDEALAKALTNSQQENTATGTASQHNGKQRDDSRKVVTDLILEYLTIIELDIAGFVPFKRFNAGINK